MDNDTLIWESPKSWRLERIWLEHPGGEPVEQGVIRHPGAVGLMPLTQNDEILMLAQYRLPLKRTIYEIPAGTKAWGEDWLPCAQRELREETGYRAEKFESLGEIWPMPGSSDEIIRLYIATELEHDPLPQDFDEEIEVIPMSFERCKVLAMNGEINDSKTLAALFRLESWFAAQSKPY